MNAILDVICNKRKEFISNKNNDKDIALMVRQEIKDKRLAFIHALPSFFIGADIANHITPIHNSTSLLTIIVSILVLSWMTHSILMRLYFYAFNKATKSNALTLSYTAEPYFNQSLIDDNMHNVIKLNLSMDEYKALIYSSENRLDITYGHLITFLEKQKENKRLEIAKQQAKERYPGREHFFTEEIINIKQEVNL